MRRAATSALGQLGRADERVLELAWADEVDAMVRRDAAVALGQLERAEEAGEILLELARDDRVDDGARRAAYESLKALVGTATD